MSTRFLSIEELEHMPTPKWAIEGLFETGSLVMLAGPSYSFKSFLLLDWLLHIATGRQWLDRHTVKGKVAYVLGEGKASLLKRVQAWITHNKLSMEEREALNDNFRVSFEVAQLANKHSVDKMLADLDEESFEPEFIAIDTFARSMVGLDENDARDTGMWIAGADHLRQLGFTVIFLHHTKKNTELGVQYRGSSAIIGAMDTAMTLVRDNAFCTLAITKQKDHDEGLPMRFRRVEIGIGGGMKSCVLERVEADPGALAQFDEYERAPKMDITNVVNELRVDTSFESDRARARELAKRTGLSETAARKRISRAEGEQ